MFCLLKIWNVFSQNKFVNKISALTKFKTWSQKPTHFSLAMFSPIQSTSSHCFYGINCNFTFTSMPVSCTWPLATYKNCAYVAQSPCMLHVFLILPNCAMYFTLCHWQAGINGQNWKICINGRSSIGQRPMEEYNFWYTFHLPVYTQERTILPRFVTSNHIHIS